MKRWLAAFLCMAAFLSSCGGREQEQFFDGQSQLTESGQQAMQPDVTSSESEPLKILCRRLVLTDKS